MSKSHANRLIDSGKVASEMAPVGAKITTERQARELSKVEPERRHPGGRSGGEIRRARAG